LAEAPTEIEGLVKTSVPVEFEISTVPEMLDPSVKVPERVKRV